MFNVLRNSFHVNAACAKSSVVKLKSNSSNQWMTRHLSDPYVRKAKMLNYRCRSAFKLLEIDERFRILQPGHVIVDCGAAPGSWTQVAVAKTNSIALEDDLNPRGSVIAVDRQLIYPIKGAAILGNSDFTQPQTQEELSNLLNGRLADVIMSDMAPNATGIPCLDHENMLKLCYTVLDFAVRFTKPGGTLLVKLWQCAGTQRLQNDLGVHYDKVRIVKPGSSRTDSSEIFLLARTFIGTNNTTKRAV